MTLHGVQQPAPNEAVYGVMCVPFPANGTRCSSGVIHDWRQALHPAGEGASAPTCRRGRQRPSRRRGGSAHRPRAPRPHPGPARVSAAGPVHVTPGFPTAPPTHHQHRESHQRVVGSGSREPERKGRVEDSPAAPTAPPLQLAGEGTSAPTCRRGRQRSNLPARASALQPAGEGASAPFSQRSTQPPATPTPRSASRPSPGSPRSPVPG